MRPFNNDHPHLRSPPGAMSVAELRYWFKELATNPAYGWAGHTTALARALGFQDKTPASSLKSKFREKNRAWIYPSEQLRFSKTLKRILSGHVVCRKVGQYWKAVLAHDPQPLKLPLRFRYNLSDGRLEWVRPEIGTRPVLPSFQALFSGAQRGTFRG